MARKLIFNKWRDPVKGLLTESPDAELQEKREQWGFDEEHPPIGTVHLGPSIVTPEHGVIPLHESNLPSALYRLWMVHTNFDVTEQVASTVENVPGIETLDIISRYRFRIGIAMAFDQTEVKNALRKALAEPKRITGAMAVAGIRRA